MTARNGEDEFGDHRWSPSSSLPRSFSSSSCHATPTAGVFSEAYEEGPPVEPCGAPRRVYYLDWFRIVAIYLVVMYHCVQSLGWIGLWDREICSPAVAAGGTDNLVHPKCVRVFEASVNVYKSFSLMVGMPTFFHISGRAQALARPRGLRETVIKRVVRLGAPFIVAYMLLVPYWQYIEYRDSDEEKYVQLREEGMPFHFFPWLMWFFEGHFEFNAAWLWFLPALLLIGVFGSPIFLFAETLETKYAIITIIFWGCFVFILLGSGFDIMMCFFVVLAPAVAMLVSKAVRFAPLGDTSWNVGRSTAMLMVSLTYIGSQMGIVLSFRYSDTPDYLKPMPATILLLGFYVQGYFAQRWESDVDMEKELGSDSEEMGLTSSKDITSRSSGYKLTSTRRESNIVEDLISSVLTDEEILVTARVARVFTGFVTILIMAVGAPAGEWEEELFPLYSASYKPGYQIGVNQVGEESAFFAVAHIAATWAYVHFTVAYFKAYADYEMHPQMYEHASKSTMVTYIFHFVFCKSFAFWVCKDYGLTSGVWLLLDPILTFGFTVMACVGVYVVLIRYPVLGSLFGL